MPNRILRIFKLTPICTQDINPDIALEPHYTREIADINILLIRKIPLGYYPFKGNGSPTDPRKFVTTDMPYAPRLSPFQRNLGVAAGQRKFGIGGV